MFIFRHLMALVLFLAVADGQNHLRGLQPAMMGKCPSEVPTGQACHSFGLTCSYDYVTRPRIMPSSGECSTTKFNCVAATACGCMAGTWHCLSSTLAYECPNGMPEGALKPCEPSSTQD